ncbi:MAG: alanine--tRNA ligase-related protein [Lachnospiraceae bacterium]
MTRPLYYEDSSITEFRAEVISCEKAMDQQFPNKGKKEFYQVVLDQTAFFPEGGGQSPDVGTLEGQAVIDVQEINGVIYHALYNPLQVGRMVTGRIDWTERFIKMQQHSGEHIVSGLVNQRLGYDNVGFRLGTEAVTMDFNGVITKEQLQEIEYLANQGVIRNIPIQISYPSKEKLKDLTYRSKIEIEGQVRIITIEGYDVCACCAPHVKTTGEIGLIKLTDIQNHRGGVRITMVCGFRALYEFRAKEESVRKISVLLSAKEGQVAEAVERLKEENQMLKISLQKKQNQIIGYMLQDLPKGTKLKCVFESSLSGDGLRELVNQMVQKGTRIGAAFVGTNEDGYRYIIGSKCMDVRSIAKELNSRFDGRGGGKPEMVQGSLKGSQEDIQRRIEELVDLFPIE